ncbi:SNF1-related protein kinase regulatory subunit beta-3-like isoform X1 [Salvia divinorum]|uniref:SNF1-related protein kinase regulatory subunit beta-3-like isoform X1 n=2 Tax=Salvia divinorum TaxID=28513 RepID=A0ABD1HQQ3_SALDI
MEFCNIFSGSFVPATMNHRYGEDQDRVSVVGFDVPNSPEASYNNVYPGNEDEGREPPSLPPHLQHTLLNQPATSDSCAPLPSPQNVTLNHLYIENREPPRTVVALGVTHRFRSKFVTVVLYKPVPRR